MAVTDKSETKENAGERQVQPVSDAPVLEDPKTNKAVTEMRSAGDTVGQLVKDPDLIHKYMDRIPKDGSPETLEISNKSKKPREEEIKRADGSTLKARFDAKGQLSEVEDSKLVSAKNPKGIWKPEISGAFVSKDGRYGYAWKDPANPKIQHELDVSASAYMKRDAKGEIQEVWTGINEKMLVSDKGSLSLKPDSNSQFLKIDRDQDGSISKLQINNLHFSRDGEDKSKWRMQAMLPGENGEKLSEKSEPFAMTVKMENAALVVEQNKKQNIIRFDGKTIESDNLVYKLKEADGITAGLKDESGRFNQVIGKDGSIYKRIGEPGKGNEQEEWQKIGSKDTFKGSWSIGKAGELEFSGKLPSAESELAGAESKRDKSGRLLEIRMQGEKRSFEYKEGLEIPSAFSINDKRYTLDEKSLKQGITVYREETAKGNGDVILGRPDREGNIRSIDPENKSTVILKPDGTRLAYFENGSRLSFARDGSLDESIDSHGVKTSFKSNTLKDDVQGRAMEKQLNSFSVFDPKSQKGESWSTVDGFNWKVKTRNSDGKETESSWQGFVKIDPSGRLSKLGADGKLETRALDGQKKETISFDLDARASEIEKALKNPSDKKSHELIRAQVQDLSGEQTYILRQKLESGAPQAGGITKMIETAFKDAPAFKQLELKLFFDRKGQAGEHAAIQLLVDAAELKAAKEQGWFGAKTRSQDEITRSTRHILGTLSEQERLETDSALKALNNGQGLKEFFAKGDGKLIAGADDYTKKLLDLSVEKGVDKRSPQEQAELMKLALTLTPNEKFKDIFDPRELRFRYFTEASSLGFASDEGRKLFRESGGLDLINPAFTFQGGIFMNSVRDANEFARNGETERLTEFRRGFGLMANAQESMDHALKGLSTEERLQLASGMAIVKEGREATSEAERAAVRKFKEFEQSTKDAHQFQRESKSLRYIDQALQEGGTDISKILNSGSLFSANPEKVFQIIENMDLSTFKQFSIGQTADSKSSYYKSYTEALRLALGSGQAYQKALERLNTKLESARQLEKHADTIIDSKDPAELAKSANVLRAQVPAFRQIEEAKWSQMLAGLKLSKQLEKEAKPAASLTKEELASLSAYNESPLRSFVEGRSIAQRLALAENKQQAYHDLLKSTGPDSSAYERYQSLLQSATKADFDKLVDTSKSFNPKTLLASLQALSPEDPAFQRSKEELYAIVDQKLGTSPATYNLAAKLIIDKHLDKELAKDPARAKLLDYAIDVLGEHAKSGGISEPELARRLSRILKDDKDGSIQARLTKDEKLKDALSLIFHNSSARSKQFLESMEKDGGLSGMAASGLAPALLFKAALLDSSPQALRFLANEKEARTALILNRLDKAGFGDLARKIIQAGEVKPEHLIKAASQGLGEAMEHVLRQLDSMDADTRARTLNNYYAEFKTQARADLLKADDGKNKDAILQSTRAQDLEAIQIQIQKQKEAFSTDEGTGAALTRAYSRVHLDQLSRFQQARWKAEGDLSGEKLSAELAKLEHAVQIFKDTKKETVDAFVNGTLMVAGLIAPPLVGYTSLASLSGAARLLSLSRLSAGAGVYSSVTKAALKGNDKSTLREIVGNFTEGALLFGTSFVGPEYAAGLHRLGYRTADGAVERGVKSLAASELRELQSAGVRESLEQGMKKLVSHNLAYAQNVKDEAVVSLVKSLHGLSDATKAKLAQGLLQGLKDETLAQSRSVILSTLAREGGSAVALMETGAAANFLVELNNQIIKQETLDLDRLVIATGTGAVMAAGIAIPLRGLTALSRNKTGSAKSDLEPAARARSESEIAPQPYASPSEMAKGLDDPAFASLSAAEKNSLLSGLEPNLAVLEQLKRLSPEELASAARAYGNEVRLPLDLAVRFGKAERWELHAAEQAWQKSRFTREDGLTTKQRFEQNYNALREMGPDRLFAEYPNMEAALKHYHKDLLSHATAPIDKDTESILHRLIVNAMYSGDNALELLKNTSGKNLMGALESLDPGLVALKALAERLSKEGDDYGARFRLSDQYWQAKAALGLDSVFGANWKSWLSLQKASATKAGLSADEMQSQLKSLLSSLPVDKSGRAQGLDDWLLKKSQEEIRILERAPLTHDEMLAAAATKVEKLRKAGVSKEELAAAGKLSENEIAAEEIRLAAERANAYRASRQDALNKGETTGQQIEQEISAAERNLALYQQQLRQFDEMKVVATSWARLSPEQRNSQAIVNEARAVYFPDTIDQRFAAEAIAKGVKPEDFSALQARLLVSERTPSPFPLEKRWESGDYVGYFLPRGDRRAMLLNHPENSELIAKQLAYGQENPDGGIFVIADKNNPGEIKAYGWAYVRDGKVVISEPQLKVSDKRAAAQVKTSQDEARALSEPALNIMKAAARDLSATKFKSVSISVRDPDKSAYQHLRNAEQDQIISANGYRVDYSDIEQGRLTQKILAENPTLTSPAASETKVWLRVAGPHDYDTVKEISKAAFPGNYQSSISGDQYTLVLMVNDKAVGYAKLKKGDFVVDDLGILPAHRNFTTSFALLNGILDLVEKSEKTWTAARSRATTTKTLLSLAASRRGATLEILSDTPAGTFQHGNEPLSDIKFRSKPKKKN